MSDVLMDLIKGAVSKQVMGKIGGVLGQPPEKTSSAFETAAGAILGGLIKKAGTPGGAKDIFKAAGDQDDSVLDKLGDILGGGQTTQEFEKQGGGVLDMVFGGDDAVKGGMLGALAKYLGMNEDLVGKLLKMAAPIIMGVVGRYVKRKAIDAVGLGSFLGEQKKSLGNYLPASLSKDLGFGDMLGDMGDASKKVSGAAAGASRAVTGAASDAANSGGSLLKMLIPLIVIGLLGWLAYTYLLKPAGDGAGKIGDGVKAGTAAIGDVNFGDFDMAGLNAQIQGITNGLKDVSTENVNGLADKITGLTGSMDGMGFNKLTGPAKSAVGTALSGFTKSVESSLGGITNDGFMGILKPVIDALLEKIKSLGF